MPRWFEVFADVVRSRPVPRDDDRPGQHYRRAIIAGATAAEPFPGEIRGKALLVESAVRAVSLDQLLASGGAGAVCRALGAASKVSRPQAWERDLERGVA